MHPFVPIWTESIGKGTHNQTDQPVYKLPGFMS